MSEQNNEVTYDPAELEEKVKNDTAFPPQPDFDRDAENNMPPEKTEGS